MFDFIPHEIFGFKVLHLVPLLLFGPFFLFVFYNMALRDIIHPTPEVRALRKRQKAERLRQKKERKRLAKIEKERIKAAGENPTFPQYAAQALFFVPFAVVVGYLSTSPAYTTLGPDMAVLKLSMSIPGKHKEKCLYRTKEELAKLPANKRVKKVCPRERWPVFAELKLDGETIYRESVPPVGLKKDGQSRFYQSFKVSAGKHKLFLGISGGGESENFDHVLEKDVTLSPAEVLVFSFDNGKGEIYTK